MLGPGFNSPRLHCRSRDGCWTGGHVTLFLCLKCALRDWGPVWTGPLFIARPRVVTQNRGRLPSLSSGGHFFSRWSRARAGLGRFAASLSATSRPRAGLSTPCRPARPCNISAFRCAVTGLCLTTTLRQQPAAAKSHPFRARRRYARRCLRCAFPQPVPPGLQRLQVGAHSATPLFVSLVRFPPSASTT